MAKVTGLTAARMLEIENASIVDARLNDYDLILTNHEGQDINVGNVRGPQGPEGPIETPATIGAMINSTADKTSPVDADRLPLMDSEVGNVIKKFSWLSVKDRLKEYFDTLYTPINNISTQSGLLDPTYRFGSSKVKIDGTLSSNSFEWLTPYKPQGNRVVNLLTVGSSTKIIGQAENNSTQLPLNKTYWYSYNDVNDISGTTLWSSAIKVTKLPSGLVVLSGLLSSITLAPAGSLIATLPVGYRPDNCILHPVLIADFVKTISIETDGSIRVYGQDIPANYYLGLDGVTFWAAGVANWVPIGSGGSSFGVRFSNHAPWDAIYGYPSYWKDPYGFVWFRGLVRALADITIENDIIANLPSNYKANLEQHFIATGDPLHPLQGAGSGYNHEGLVHKNITGKTLIAGGAKSLAGICIQTNDSKNSNAWVTPPALGNSWVNCQPSNYPSASYLLREDGLRMLSGLIKFGVLGQAVMLLSEKEYHPENGRQLFPAIASAGEARINIHGTNDGSTAGLISPTRAVNGHNWFSIDQIKWIP